MGAGDAALFALVTAALALEAVLGFGATVIVVSLGAQFIALDALLPAYVPVNLLLSVYLVATGWRSVDTRLLVGRVLPPMLLGMAAAMALPADLDASRLLVAFGVFTVGISVPEVWAALRAARGAAATPSRPPGRLLGGGLLALGGVIHGLFGSGGPMVVYVLGRAGLDKTIFRATLSALWCVLSVALIVRFSLRGLMTEDTARRAALILPALLLGGTIGDRLHARVDVRRFRLSVFSVLALAGLALITRNL